MRLTITLMKYKNIYYTIASIFFTLLTLCGVVYLVFTINNRANYYALKERLSLHASYMSEMQHIQFAFFHNKDHSHIKRFKEKTAYFDALLSQPLYKELFHLRITISSPPQELSLAPLESLLATYKQYNEEIYTYEEVLGLDHEHGLYGSLRRHVHALEARLKKSGNSTLMAEMLTLRRHEKDFMLRGLKDYHHDFVRHARLFEEKLSHSHHKDKTLLLGHLTQYMREFERFVYYYEIVGRANNSGLIGKASEVAQDFSTAYETRYESIAQHIERIDTLERITLLFITLNLLMLVTVIMLSRREIEHANERNPLTGLNGNNRINAHLQWIAKHQTNRIVIYFDFDYFKPFNDAFGFKKGDEIIHAFAMQLKEIFGIKYHFIGHIGGDDFIVVCEKAHFEKTLKRVELIAERFAQSAKSYYTDHEQLCGFKQLKDRFGQEHDLPLLSVSASIIEIRKHRLISHTEEISQHFSIMKESAKKSAICAVSLL